MIFGWIRLFVLGFLALTVAYVLVSIYSRSVRREKLENEFDKGEVEGDRDAFIAQGMEHYEKGLKRRLIWLVYIIPMVAMAVTVYIINWD